MVVAGGAEDELAQDFAGGGVDDGDVEIGDEQDHGVRAWVRPMPMWWRVPP